VTVARVIARFVVVALLGASLLPLANWIPSERSSPWYSAVLGEWVFGTIVVTAVAAGLGWASIRSTGLWREGVLSRLLGRFDPARPVALATVAVGAAALYLGVAVAVFERRPLLVDEIVLLFQARTYAAGQLSLPVDADPAFRSMLHLIEYRGRWFGHFPPGWPLLLMLGELREAAWIVGPLAGGVAVWAWGLVLRRAESRPPVRSGALLLLALAPFPAFMAGSALNHAGTLMWLLLALAGWLRVLERPSLAVALGSGLALGMAAITRPADAVAFGVPALAWVAIWWRATRAHGPLGAACLGAAIPIVGMLVVNAQTTGSAFTLGYEFLWGPNVRLGFHPAPYGPDHTVVRGIELLSLNLLRLNRYLFEAPVPGLLPAAIALLLATRLNAVNRYLLAAGGALLLTYFAYWHDGFFLGPRFAYPLVPVIALWTARFPRALGRFGEGPRRAAAYWVGLAALGAVAIGIPVRAGQNATIQPAMRFDADRAAAAAGIDNAIVFVRETWGAQLLARLWALGVGRPAAERYYRSIDSCRLDRALAEAEASPGESIEARLDPLLADSSRLVASPFSPDTSERFLPGSTYSARCRDRVSDDRAGTALLAPTLLSRRADLLFARDLHERNAKLILALPEKRSYLLARGPADSVPTFRLLSRDSMLGSSR